MNLPGLPFSAGESHVEERQRDIEQLAAGDNFPVQRAQAVRRKHDADDHAVTGRFWDIACRPTAPALDEVVGRSHKRRGHVPWRLAEPLPLLLRLPPRQREDAYHAAKFSGPACKRCRQTLLCHGLNMERTEGQCPKSSHAVIEDGSTFPCAPRSMKA